ncbi:hypothetical protein GSI_02041 [Ganoderma sinense ZZ0214-1]|uniref:Uncharacterized protein n=1 Tax=Ganoderma sinense ZZ0214-1 TaxID=1077348 RepID=A0A2G8SNG7_9APHY|nr:hypothetical protein GSI_02041 [Ganoderma sinense ZZ0214-1]
MAPVASTPHPHATVRDPLANAKSSLNLVGAAGFFGGDIAVHGMATVIFFFSRRFGGLYNAPGSLEVARRYGQLAGTRVYRGLFPGGDTTDPAQLFGLDGKDGPKFFAAHSGSLFERTSHLGYLIARMALRRKCEKPDPHPTPLTQAERTTYPGTVTIIDLNHLPEDQPKKLVHPEVQYRHYGLLALIPILTSIGACVGSALVADWWSFGCILIGMVANGCACFVLGSGKIAFQHPEPAQGAPPGDGVLWAGRNDVVVIRGSERAVNTVTRGRFFLQYDEDAHDAPFASNGPPAENGANSNVKPDGDSNPLLVKGGEQQKPKRDGSYDAPKGGKPNSFWIGIASLLLILQFLVQLLLIPQATLFGQLMFVCTLAVSGGYNAYLSSMDREDIQTRILNEILKLDEEPEGDGQGRRPQKIRKFGFGTWTATSTFACLALQPDSHQRLPDTSKVLNTLIPNDTEVWNRWKGILKGKLQSKESWSFTPEDRKLRVQGSGNSQSEAGVERRVAVEPNPKDEVLLDLFITDAEVAYQRYRNAFHT